MPQPLIEVRQLRYRYADGTEALKEIDFELSEGETVILLGANGSGKTTFLLHLNGLLLGEGQVTVCGTEVNRRNLAEIRRRVGIVFQDADEQLVMPTVLEDVAFGPLNHGVPRERALAAARETILRMNLGHCLERAPYHLSSGEKRRAAIAGILAMDPSVLILDEPTTFLDPPGQRSLIQTLASLHQAKIVATHDCHLAKALGTRAVFFEGGRVAASGPVEEILDRFSWRA